VSASYAPLWCKSNFSFLEGASHPEELVEAAPRLGLPGLALTDRDGVHGAVRAHVTARALGVRLVLGAQATLDDGSRLLLLAADRGGWANLCRLLTKGRLRSPKGESRVTVAEVAEHAAGLLALLGGEGSLLAAEEEGPAERAAGALRDAFGDRLHALVARHRRAEEARAEARTRARAARFGLPVVAATETLYHDPSRRRLQDVLTCIRHGVALASAGRRLRPNAGHALLPPDEMEARFRDDPRALARSLEILERCAFSLAELRYRYPLERLPDGRSPSEQLRARTFVGARERYPDGVPERVRVLLEKELALIEELDYGGYFLTMREIVGFCRERGILCQGRGSAANSAVCYCLGVTAVDPARVDVLFERFLSRERAEPPDIDLDIQHERREEVIGFVYGRYGRAHAAMVANVIRYRPRSAAREVGKALGIPETSLDRVAKRLFHGEEADAGALREAGLDPDAPACRHLVALTREILDFPRHLSIHPGGFLLGQEPVHDLVPIENATMEGRTVIQWDKRDVEDLGLFKLDLLGLGALSHLDRAFALLREHKGIDLSLAGIPEGDAATYDMLGRGETVGVFQVESRAQMAMLPRLRPRCFYDLVIEVSIVRPGPITGGMVHPYLRRRNGEEPVRYPHPSLEPVLRKTLGVPLFQEQVMRLAMVAADYTPGEADQLRRDMAAWGKGGRMEKHRERLVGRMVAKGIAPAFAEAVFRQILGFGEYGFPESHAASFALLAYATAWLRCHYPAEFTCSLLNAQPMGFYAPATILGDAKRRGIEVRPVSCQTSVWDCTLEPCGSSAGGLALRMGLRYVRGLASAEAARIVEARRAGPFRDLGDFVRRTKVNAKSRAFLASSGALRDLRERRREALWDLAAAGEDLPLLRGVAPAPVPFDGLSEMEEVAWDYRATGLSPRAHPLGPFREALRAAGLPDARSLRAMRDGARARYAGLVICRQRPGTAGGITFMTLEDETGFVNLIVRPEVFARHELLGKTAAFLGATGVVQNREGVTNLLARALWSPRLGRRPERVPSRDFR